MRKTYSFCIYNNDEFENLLRYMANAFCPSFLKWPTINEAARLNASYFDDIVKAENGEICIERQDTEKQLTSKYIAYCIKKFMLNENSLEEYTDSKYNYSIPLINLKFYYDFLSGKTSKFLIKKYSSELVNEKIGIQNNPAQCEAISILKENFKIKYKELEEKEDNNFRNSIRRINSEELKKEKEEIINQYFKLKAEYAEQEKQIRSI